MKKHYQVVVLILLSTTYCIIQCVAQTPADNPLEIDHVLNGHSSRHWAFHVYESPVFMHGDLWINDTSCEIYFLNESGFQDWSSHLYTSNYIRLASFAENLTFWERLDHSGDYYIGVVNHGDNAVHVSGIWLTDEWPPEIAANISDGAIVEGIVAVNVTAQDDYFGVSGMSLDIDGYEVATSESEQLTYVWNTMLYSDGQHTLRIEAADNAENTASTTITVEVRNQTTDTNGDGTTGMPGWVYIIIGLFGLVIIASGVSWWREQRRAT